MTNHPSVAVIGGGIIGLSTAWRLAQAGCEVTLYDKGRLGREASWAGAGMLAPGGEVDPNSSSADSLELSSLCIASRNRYRDFVEELTRTTSVEVDYQECGGLDLAYTDTDWTALQARAERQWATNIYSKPITPEKIAVFWPRIERNNLRGALFYPGDGLVDPRELVKALITAAEQLDVHIRVDESVNRIDVRRSAVFVEGSGGRAKFDQVVLAAGAWSTSIQVEGVPSVPAARPIKGHLIGYRQPDQTCGTIVRRGHTYLLQRANGLLIVGASVEDVGFDRSIVNSQVDDLAAQGGAILPHLSETSITETWMGFRPASDKVHIGRWHNSALLLAYGHYRNGILLAPVTADRVCQQITSS